VPSSSRRSGSPLRVPSAQSDTRYMMPLPSDVIRFNSPEGRKIFKDCVAEGGTEGSYYALADAFTTQEEAGSCGLGSLVMVLNSLLVDSGSQLFSYAPWRWYNEALLKNKSTFLGPDVHKRGVTIPQLARVAYDHQLQCSTILAGELRAPTADFAPAPKPQIGGIDTFRDDLKRASFLTPDECSATARCGEHRMIAAFSRASMKQSGVGHFSPVGAYSPKHDMCLVMDVARFKYPSYWAPAEMLWDSMKEEDKDTGLPRGYMMLKKACVEHTGHGHHQAHHRLRSAASRRGG